MSYFDSTAVCRAEQRDGQELSTNGDHTCRKRGESKDVPAQPFDIIHASLRCGAEDHVAQRHGNQAARLREGGSNAIDADGRSVYKDAEQETVDSEYPGLR